MRPNDFSGEIITSPHNEKIKRLVALQQKSSLRRESGLFVVEGEREIGRCLECGYEIDSLFFVPEISGEAAGRIAPGAGRAFAVSSEVYARIACRESTEGMVAEVRGKSFRLQDLPLGRNPLLIVLESVEKPGNLGAVLRSADAAGADAVIVCDPLTDIYNPNVIRASVGAVFSVPVAACTSEEAIDFLKAGGIRILTAQLQDSSLYYDCPMTGPTAIIMGTEATGLTPLWREAADAHIRIPMLGKMDSLNVSVSAAVLVFEALRQRHNSQKI